MTEGGGTARAGGAEHRLGARRPGSRAVWIALGIAAALLPILLHRELASNDAVLYALDHAQLQYPRFRILGDALRGEHQLPLWQTALYAGSPFHANPEVPTLYPPIVLLCALFPPLLAQNLTILLHLGLGALGTYCLVLRLWRSRAPALGYGDGTESQAAGGAFVAALAFGLNYYTRTEHLNLVIYGAAHALIPWMLFCAEGVLVGARPARSAGCLALLIAAQVFTGGLYVIVYTAIGLALWFAFLGLLAGARARRRALTFGALAAGLGALIALAKLWPYADWTPVTNRSGALSWEEVHSTSIAGDFGELRAHLAYLKTGLFTGSFTTVALALLGLAALKSGVVRFALLVSLAAWVFALGPPFRVLYELGAPFDRMRDGAERTWVLANALLPVAAGFGACRLANLVAQSSGRAWLGLALGVALGLGSLPLLLGSGRQGEQLSPKSFEELLTRYPNWSEAARIAGDEWRAISYDRRVLGERNEQFVSTALGVETPAGFLGYIWPPALERHLYGEGETLPSRDARLRRLAVLSVRPMVTQGVTRGDERPKADDARTLVPSWVDGARVELDPAARARAIAPGRVLALVGDTDRRALYTLLDAPGHPLLRSTLIAYGEGDEPSDEELAAVDLFVLVGGIEAAPTELRARLERQADLGRRAVAFPRAARAVEPELVAAVCLRLSEDAPLAERCTFERTSTDSARVERPSSSSDGFVVLSETWALHGGWRVVADSGREVPVRSADGVVTAVFLRAGEASFRASYEPRAARTGFLSGGVGLVGALLAIGLSGRRRAA